MPGIHYSMIRLLDLLDRSKGPFLIVACLSLTVCGSVALIILLLNLSQPRVGYYDLYADVFGPVGTSRPPASTPPRCAVSLLFLFLKHAAPITPVAAVCADECL